MSAQSFKNDGKYSNIPASLKPDTEGCDCNECVGGCFRKLLTDSQPVTQEWVDSLMELVGDLDIDLDAPLSDDET